MWLIRDIYAGNAIDQLKYLTKDGTDDNHDMIKESVAEAAPKKIVSVSTLTSPLTGN